MEGEVRVITLPSTLLATAVNFEMTDTVPIGSLHSVRYQLIVPVVFKITFWLMHKCFLAFRQKYPAPLAERDFKIILKLKFDLGCRCFYNDYCCAIVHGF